MKWQRRDWCYGSRRLAQVNGQIATPPNIQATGATVDFNLSNVAILQSVGGTAITVSNMADGGVYMMIVSDAT